MPAAIAAPPSSQEERKRRAASRHSTAASGQYRIRVLMLVGSAAIAFFTSLDTS
jgi:hypothetical protein